MGRKLCQQLSTNPSFNDIVADLSALREQYGTEIAAAIEYQSFI
ncbi:hypothetical protein [Brochothrix thermosphacta]|nr:hypothetical protein [Brochothrix thermosphacta]